MEFDPNKPSTLIKSGVSFDPNKPSTLIKEGVSFDPNRPSTLIDDGEPTLGQVGTGLLAEITIGEGGKYAGATAGFALGGPAGAAVGYLGSGITSGIAGSIAAQKAEGRDEISWGRVTADTLLNLLPFGAGKVTKGAKLLPRLAGATIKRGAQGAAISTGAMSIEKGIEEGRFLTPEELLQIAGTGAALGIGLGATGSILNKSYSKLLNKNSDEINDLYKKGDVDAVTVVDAITGGDPNNRVNRLLNTFTSYVLPSKVIGSRSSAALRRGINETGAAKDIAGRVRKTLDKVYNNLNATDKRAVDDYIIGKSNILPPSAINLKDTIDEARGLISDAAGKILKLSDEGVIDLDEGFVQTIRRSIEDGSYLTREYRFYEDANYRPSRASEEKLRQSFIRALKKEGEKNPELEADRIIQKYYASREVSDSVKQGMDVLVENSKIFKQRKVLDKDLREFLGEYTTPGERFYGTISRLGRIAADQAAAFNVAKDLRISGLALRLNEIPSNMRADFNPLKINGKVIKQNIGGQREELYALKETQNSIDQLYGSRIPRDTNLLVENAITRLISTTTGMTKFAAVPLAPAAYSPQLFANAFGILGQAMNPFRGFGRGLKVAVGEIRGKKLNLKQMNEYKSLGLVDKNVFVSDIRNAFNKGFKLLPENKLGRGIGFTAKKIGQTYSAIDTANRISVFENYREVVLPKLITGVNDPKSLNYLDPATFNRLAAELTNSTYQNYDRISPSLRYLSRLGFLNEFVAFLLELTRTTFNQARLAKSLINGSFADKMRSEYGVNVNQGRAFFEGSKRLAFLSGAFGAASFGIAAYNKKNGFDNEKVRAIKETVAYDWDDTSALVIQDLGDQKVGLVNMAYRMPIADLTSIFEAGLGTESYTEAGSKFFGALSDKFFGRGTINMVNFFNALQNIDPDTGEKISKSPNRLDNVIDQATFYATESFTPGFVRDIQRLDKRTSKEIVMRYLFGERKFNTSFTDGAGRKFNKALERIRGLRNEYAADARDADDISSVYQKNNNTYRSNIEEIIKHINNLRTLGVSNQDIYNTLPAMLSKNVKIAAMKGIVLDMPVAVSIKGNRLEQTKQYINLIEKMPRDLATKMLKQELSSKKINRAQLNTIVNAIKLKNNL
tara:strand:+ start:4587 stop:7979 length:3393 start_codon:yes stop_codon:yes gene_type:complete